MSAKRVNFEGCLDEEAQKLIHDWVQGASLIELDRRAEHGAAAMYALRKEDAKRSMIERETNGGCVVYFVQELSTGAVKIGVTGNLKSRFYMLRVNSPHEMVVLAHVPGDERLERYLHDRFCDSCIRGEWFRLTPELLACIEELKKGPPVISDAERLLIEEVSKTWVAPFAVPRNRKNRKWR